MGMARRDRNHKSAKPAARSELNINQIVAYNLRAGRKLRGWTQEALARRLEIVTEAPFSHAMVSALERAWDGERHREFDAHEIALFAVALDLPMAWFFLPPDKEYRYIEQIGRSAREMHVLLLGRHDQVGPLEERMRKLSSLYSPTDPTLGGLWDYRKRRKELILAMLDEQADDLDRAVEEIGRFFDHLRQVGIRGFVAENALDTDYATMPEYRSDPNLDTSSTADTPPDHPLDDHSPDVPDSPHEASPDTKAAR